MRDTRTVRPPDTDLAPPDRPQSPRRPSNRLTRLWRWLPGLALLGCLAYLTHEQHTGYAAIARYWAALGWSIVLPGMLVYRALRGRPSTILADIAFGGATGILLQLCAWAALTASGLQHWLILWPAPVVVAFVAIPALRKNWTIAPYKHRLNPATTVGIAFAGIWLVRSSMRLVAATPLPPAPSRWYPDLYWHLALVGELLRSVPPQVPQVAGDMLSYHWLSNAHIAAMTLSTGLDTPLVFTRLWMMPILLLGLLTIAAVGQRLTGRAWPGALAAIMASLSPALLTAWFGYSGTSAFNTYSPSLQFAVPLTMLALVLILDIFRGARVRWGSCCLLVLALAGVAGAKASVIPVLLCGVALAVVIAALTHRDILRSGLVTLAATVIVFVCTWPLVAGGGGGSSVQFFSTFRTLDPWIRFAGDPLSIDLLPPGIDQPGGWTLLVVLVIGWLIAYAWVLLGLPALTTRNLAAWVLLGSGIGGLVAMWLVNQGGLSQVYFMGTALLAWYLLAAWGFALLVDAAVRQSRTWTAIGTAVAGLSAGALMSSKIRLLAAPPLDPSHLAATVGVSFVPWAGLALLFAVLLVATRGHSGARAVLRLGAGSVILGAALGTTHVDPLRPGPDQLLSTVVTSLAVVLLVTAAAVAVFARTRKIPGSPHTIVSVVLVICLVVGSVLTVATHSHEGGPPPRKPGRDVSLVNSAEQRAARWLRANSAPTDVVATNVHCSGKATTDHCDARGFWVGAFTERRMLVESWAYTSQAHSAEGQDGYPYTRQPFYDPTLFALNESAFYRPSVKIMEDLRDKHVRFLFADSEAGRISPELASLANRVHQDGSVTIYEI